MDRPKLLTGYEILTVTTAFATFKLHSASSRRYHKTLFCKSNQPTEWQLFAASLITSGTSILLNAKITKPDFCVMLLSKDLRSTLTRVQHGFRNKK